MKRRVVVTGLGIISPIGNDIDTFWENVKKGTVGIGEITKFDTTDFKVKLAAEVKDFDATKYMDKREARRMELFSQYAVAAAKQAVEDSVLDLEKTKSGPILFRKNPADFCRKEALLFRQRSQIWQVVLL